MQLIPFSQLSIPEYRMRREFDPAALKDLSDSILSKGLMHPLVVVAEPAGNFRLIAGERRSRAIRALADLEVTFSCNNQEIRPGLFPVILLGDLPPLALLEAEYEENVVRSDLTWQEQALATAALAELRKLQAVENGTPFTLQGVATEITGKPAEGAAVTKVSNAVIVSRHLADPDVAGAKSQKEALKIIEKKAATAHREVLAQSFDLKKTPHTALLGSSLELAASLPSDKFSVILTDPPYGVGADNFGSMATTSHEYKDDLEYALNCYRMVAQEGFRVTKAQAHAYVFLDIRYFPNFSLEFSMAGWVVWPTPIIWAKNNGMLPRPEHGPRRTYECLLYAIKGGKRVNKVLPDVLTYPTEGDKFHGAQKPVPLYTDLLSRSCVPGDEVVDFFSGSGTIFAAANELKLVATGLELNKEYYEVGVTRIMENSEPPKVTEAISTLFERLNHGNA